MIAKENRLKKNKHFNYIYKTGQSKSTKFITLVFSKTKFKYYKVGFSISKKIGKSVVRNKIKRRMREIFNLVKNNINIKYNYIFVAKPDIKTLTFEELKQNMILVLKKAELYNEI